MAKLSSERNKKKRMIKKAKKIKEKKILSENFNYDKFFNSLLKEIWNLIISFLGKDSLNSLFLTSKSFFHFLNLNPPNCWKTVLFYNYRKFKWNECNFALILPPLRFRQLTKLGFSLCTFNQNTIDYVLNTQIHLSELEFRRCSLGDKGLQPIIKWLKLNSTLQSLKFWDNEITSKGIQDLCNVLQITSSLKRFTFVEYIIDYNITAETNIFTELLKENSHLEFLCLGFSPADIYRHSTEKMRILCEALKKNKTLKQLKIEEKFITPIGVEYIIKALKVNTTIELVDLEWSLNPEAKKLLQILEVKERIKF